MEIHGSKVMRKVKSATKRQNPLFSHLQNLDIWDINQGMFDKNMGR